ncbi:MAG: aldo/keto reductase, partial [Candidatus Binataceae bacterium]
FILTKCGHSSGLRHSDWSPALIEPSIARSLKRLRTDCLDVVQLHSCSEEALRNGDVVAALRRARDKGMTRFIGYSGDGAAAVYAAGCGEFDTLQTSLSIADQEAVDGAVAQAHRRGLGIVAKRPIANAVWIPRSDGLDWYYRPYRDRLKTLDYDFLRGDTGNSAAIALRFTLGVPGVHTAIVGTTKASRWAENAAVVEAGPLAPSEYDAIRARWRAVAQPDWVGQR